MKFKERIVKWDERRVLLEMDLRDVKIAKTSPENERIKSARLRREKADLALKLSELRNLELFPAAPVVGVRLEAIHPDAK